MFCVIPLCFCQKENVSLAQAKYPEYNLSSCSDLHLVGSSKLNSTFFTNSAIPFIKNINYLNFSEGSIPPLIKMGGLLEHNL